MKDYIMKQQQQQIHIIGGGIAGLSCAFRLIELNCHTKYDIHLYETSNKLGGQITHCAEGADLVWLVNSFDSSLLNQLAAFFHIERTRPFENISNYSILLDIIVKFSYDDIPSLLKLFGAVATKESYRDVSIQDFFIKNNISPYLQTLINDFIMKFLLFKSNRECMYTFCNCLRQIEIISYNYKLLILKMKQYLEDNNITIHMNTEVNKSKKHFLIRGRSNKKNILRGLKVVAVDTYSAKTKFGIRTPISLEDNETDFRTVFTIKTKKLREEFINNPSKLFPFNQMSSATVINKETQTGYYNITFLPQNYFEKIRTFSKSEFEKFVIQDLDIFSSRAPKDFIFGYPPHIQFKNNDGQITNTDKRQNMFTPIVGTYTSMPDVQSDDDMEVYICGVYVNNTDPYFTIEASIQTAFKVAETIHEVSKN